MKNKRLIVTVCILIIAAVGFAYVRAQVATDKRPAPEVSQNVRNVAAFSNGLPSLAGLVNQAKPSIVNISTTAVVKGPGGQGPFVGPNNPFKDFFGDDFSINFSGTGRAGNTSSAAWVPVSLLTRKDIFSRTIMWSRRLRP